MKKFIVITLFIVSIFVSFTDVSAQPTGFSVKSGTESAEPTDNVVSQSPLEKYREQYRRYRSQYKKYELAREEYLKWGTLSARDNAIDATRDFLLQCANTLHSYYSLLRYRCREEEDFNKVAANAALKIVDQHLAFYNQFDDKVRGATSLTKLEQLSTELTDNYEKGLEASEYVKKLISVAQLETLRKSSKAKAGKIKIMVKENPNYPGRSRILENWFAKITKKLQDSSTLHQDIWESSGEYLKYTYEFKKRKLVSNISSQSNASQALVMSVLDHLLEIIRRTNY